MSDIRTGELSVFAKNNHTSWNLIGESKNGTPETRVRCAKINIEESLFDKVPAKMNVEYEFGEIGDTAIKIRRLGEDWATPAPIIDQQEGDFNNPYNFIPAPPAKDPEGLGQGLPCGHQAYFKGRYSGSITISIRAKTPLLLLDSRNPDYDDNGHPTFDIRTKDGKPVLTPTSLKGPLRAAYEAATNSRMGAFTNTNPLGWRMGPEEGLAMIPARVSNNGQFLELFAGSLASSRNDWKEHRPKKLHNGRWKPANNLMYAAWLPRYSAGLRDPNEGDEMSLEGGGQPEHKMHVACLITKIDCLRWDRNTKKLVHAFYYWKVEKIARIANKHLLPGLDSFGSTLGDSNKHKPVRGSTCYAEGYVCITNQNIGRKHDERVFFTTEPNFVSEISLKPEWGKAWSTLIRDYQAKAKKGVSDRQQAGLDLTDFLGTDPGSTAFSRHVDKDNHAETLNPGDLCYARVNEQGTIHGLYPVMISRELADVSPFELLPDSIKPAVDIEELSPADRVFGWVRQDKGYDKREKSDRGAYKGQLRIASISPGENTKWPSAVNIFAAPLPLAILSSPKPEQFLFYGAKDQEGLPPGKADTIEPKYAVGRGLRGRKVYPHQKLPNNYWNATSSWQTTISPENSRNGFFREYIRPGTGNERTSNQNRSVTGWVNPDTTFSAVIEVTNLTEQELGALLYILSFNDGFHKLGAAKPLGFGSVAISIDSVKLRSGEEICKHYMNLSLRPPECGRFVQQDCIDAYKEAISQAYDQDFEHVSFIRSFEGAMRGHDKPVRYPRPGGLRGVPSTETNIFDWFGANNSWLDQLGVEANGLK